MAHLLHVYGVRDNSCKDDLRKIFSRCGKVVGVDKLGKGAALVGYKEKAEAEDAISTLQFTSFNGRVLEISKSTLFTPEHFSTVKEKNYGFCLREFICYSYNVYECANAAGGGQCLRGKHYCFYCFLNGRGHLAHRNRDPDCPSRQRGWEELPQHKSAEERLARVGQVMQAVGVNNQDSGRVVVPGPLRGRLVSGQAAPGGQGLVVGQCVVQGQRVMAGQKIVTAGGQSMVVSASGQTTVLPAGAQQVMAGGIRQVVQGGTRGEEAQSHQNPSHIRSPVPSEAQSHQRPSPIGDPDTVPSHAQSTQNPSQSQKEQQVLSSSRLSEQPPVGNGAVQSSLNLELDQLGDRRSTTNKENLKKIIANKRKLASTDSVGVAAKAVKPSTSRADVYSLKPSTSKAGFYLPPYIYNKLSAAEKRQSNIFCGPNKQRQGDERGDGVAEQPEMARSFPVRLSEGPVETKQLLLDKVIANRMMDSLPKIEFNSNTNIKYNGSSGCAEKMLIYIRGTNKNIVTARKLLEEIANLHREELQNIKNALK